MHKSLDEDNISTTPFVFKSFIHNLNNFLSEIIGAQIKNTIPMSAQIIPATNSSKSKQIPSTTIIEPTIETNDAKKDFL